MARPIRSLTIGALAFAVTALSIAAHPSLLVH